MLIVFGLVVGLAYGSLLSQIRRFPVPVRILIVTFGLAALALAAGRLAQDDATAQPWAAGMSAGSLVLVVMNVRQLILDRQHPAAH